MVLANSPGLKKMTGADCAGLRVCPQDPVSKACGYVRALWVYQSAIRPPTM